MGSSIRIRKRNTKGRNEKMSKTENKKTQKRMVCVVSAKGGPGKTTISQQLVEVYRAEGSNVAIFDADGQVGGLARLYADWGVHFYDLRSDGERNALLDSVASDSDIILQDLPGGSLYEVSKIVDAGDGESVEGFLSTLEDNGVRLTLIHAIDPEIESTQSVSDYLALFPADRVDHVACLNMREAKKTDSENFPYWFGFDVGGERRYGKARAKLLEAGGTEIVLPGLQVGTRAKVKASGVPFSVARESKEFSLTERAQISNFLKGFSRGLEPARSVLGLS